MTEGDDRHLLCMAVNDYTPSSRQLAYCYRCTNVGFINSSTSAAPWIVCKGAFIQDPPHSKPSTAAPAIGWQADCHQVVFSDELPFNLYDREVLQPKVILFLQSLSGAILQQDYARPHIAKTIRGMQLLPWPAYSPDMSPIEHMWDLVGWRLAHDLQLQKPNFCCVYKHNGFLFDSTSCRMAALIACVGYTKY
ncbi:transposable element Tcb2 transposase [Trichonephila clavipes]|nr:transposable element Tcb2 transposase [Trichonephila clavipes]